MNKWHGARAHRAVATTVTAVALTLSLAACGGNSGDKGKDDNGSPSGQSSGPPAQGQESRSGGEASPSASQTLATANSGTFQFVVSSATRDSGGFLTINGTITNVTGQVQIAPNAWNGKESQVNRTGSSLAAMTLVDSAQKKRYYVLRDTDGYPLTTVNIPNFEPHASVSFFAQFPSPPSSTKQVQMDFPGLPPTTIAIS
ncbi:hypothetical protein [Streptomyces sp. 8L]|uniref:hypothetical protein n=1 Tax=Streptomyces sp. 8L TaxID=2877242 RepID=UPI001CD6C0A2|nr:hypothetical protein [Streptomyces sp. 8L]MCA1221937.1 hypothetical protein [Streptomyces sp. 8L]